MRRRWPAQAGTGPGAVPRNRARVWSIAVAAGVALLAAGCNTATAQKATTSSTAKALPATTVYGQPVPAGVTGLVGVTCPSALDCWAVGSATDAATPTTAATTSTAAAATTTTAAGATTTTTTPAAGGTPAGIVATDDGGVSWHRQSAALPGASILSAIDCATIRSCMAVGETMPSAAQPTVLQGAVLVTSDGGADWRPMDAPQGAVDVVGVQCTTGQQCTALATDGATYWATTTTDGGQVWQRGGTLPSGIAGLSSLYCSSAECLAAGYTAASPGHGTGTVARSTDGGATWAAASVPTGVGLLHDVSCTGGSICLAVGTTSTTTSDVVKATGIVLVSTDAGTTWANRTPRRSVDDAFGLACAGASCATVGTIWTVGEPSTPIGGVATTVNAGATWTYPPLQYVPTHLVDVACATTTSCVAVGDDVLARMALPTPPRTTGSDHNGQTSARTTGPGSSGLRRLTPGRSGERREHLVGQESQVVEIAEVEYLQVGGGGADGGVLTQSFGNLVGRAGGPVLPELVDLTADGLGPSSQAGLVGGAAHHQGDRQAQALGRTADGRAGPAHPFELGGGVGHRGEGRVELAGEPGGQRRRAGGAQTPDDHRGVGRLDGRRQGRAVRQVGSAVRRSCSAPRPACPTGR